MPPEPAERWHLDGFIDRLDTWIATEDPPDDLRLIVTAWVLTRYDDPYQGVRREPGFPNLWFGPVPGSQHHQNSVVACSYWIEEQRHAVRCDSVATLSLPL